MGEESENNDSKTEKTGAYNTDDGKAYQTQHPDAANNVGHPKVPLHHCLNL